MANSTNEPMHPPRRRRRLTPQPQPCQLHRQQQPPHRRRRPPLSLHSLSPFLPLLLPLLLLLLLLLPCVARAQDASSIDADSGDPLDRLRAQGRQCFKAALPCIMYSNSEGSYGCAQCDRRVRQGAILEVATRDDLTIFIDSRADARVIMMPEYVFFDSVVPQQLSTAKNVVAVVVYPGEQPRDPAAGETADDIAPFENPVERWSDDWKDPNKHHNFYPPNEQATGPAAKTTRNLQGIESKFMLFPFNIFHVDAALADRIRNLRKRFFDTDPPGVVGTEQQQRANGTSLSPRYTLESVGRMLSCPYADPRDSPVTPADLAERLPKVNSSTCLRDRTCLPIGGHSVWSSLDRLDPAVPSSQRQILAVAVPIDSMAFFNEFALGASAEISSLAVQMAVAATLAKFRKDGPGKDLPMQRQIVYFAFNAQSWGYAGSDRFLHDVKEFKCKQEFDAAKGESGCINPFMPSLKFLDLRDANISVLNLGQLVEPIIGESPPNYSFYSLRRGAARTNSGSVYSALSRAFAQTRERQGFNISDGRADLVPLDASMSFRRYYPNLRDVVTLANYKDVFENRYYHSMYDNRSLTNDREFTDRETGNTFVIRPRDPMYMVANVVAKTVAELAFGSSEGLESVDSGIIDSVITCMTANWTMCDLAKEYLGSFYEVNIPKAAPGNYPSSYAPKTRLSDRNPSAAAKNALITAFYAFHNSYFSRGTCASAKDCDNFRKELNEDAKNQSSLNIVFCARRTCVASETHSHNAFGTLIEADNENQTKFKLIENPPETFSNSNPRMGDWTESAWQDDLGLCGFVQDANDFGNAILGSGIGVFLVCLVAAWLFDKWAFQQKQPRVDEELPMLSQNSPIPVLSPLESQAV